MTKLSDDDIFTALHQKPSSALDKDGWRGVMRDLNNRGVLVVTHRKLPKAVVLSVEHHLALARMARKRPTKDHLASASPVS